MNQSIRLAVCPRCQQERVVVRLDSGEWWCCVTCYLETMQEEPKP